MHIIFFSSINKMILLKYSINNSLHYVHSKRVYKNKLLNSNSKRKVHLIQVEKNIVSQQAVFSAALGLECLWELQRGG